MDEEYDVIVLGTGLKECVLSGLLSVAGKKVLHMDRNNYYGGESASLTLDQLYSKHRDGAKPPESLGRPRDYNIDLVPKLILAGGGLVKMLVHTKVSRYLDFRSVAGSYVFRDGKVSKVPATDAEALKSNLMGFFEKRRCKKFFVYLQDYEKENPKTHGGRDLTKMTMRDLMADFGLGDDTQDFIGHAMALYQDESFYNLPAIEVCDRVTLYADSLARFGKSPYIYPMYGLGELPQGFARLCAIYGGTYMLNKPIEKIEYDEEGKFAGVTSEGETAKAKIVIADPTYFEDKCEKKGEVVRAICILNHPVVGTDNADSAQIIIPQKQVNRANDIYVAVIAHDHQVCAANKWIAIVSTNVETTDAESELEPGFKLLGAIEEKFVWTSPMMFPKNNSAEDNVFLSSSYDASSHFESSVTDILDIYNKVTGEPLDLSKLKSEDEEQE
eukprot:TRINITY_DN1665_c0_g1_i1.p1 TRINITY_DN1665_c0_g1~~TRINITY_DN1665_c0_g1_i1.p1  ORF type:complete len:443 (+),score=152.16 TRINITY_DN1665_c0_g1_i1:49-1377(+)